MEKQSLKKLIKGANKRVTEGGDSLLAKADANERTGTVAEVVEVLESFESLFDDAFRSDLPSLTKHLETRKEDNLKMLTEVINDRLSFLHKQANPEPEPAVEEPEEEEDLASLLDQKSVDEMSDEEMSSINMDGGAEPVEEEPVPEAPAEEGIGLDALIQEVGEKSDDDVPSPAADNDDDDDDDIESLLEQKSVDEMDLDEMDSIDSSDKKKNQLRLLSPNLNLNLSPSRT